ncbi:hypothetical protein ElyMa_003354100 [Elysia marginata]|uniref:Uncharacterized protein n=1 Tax=Elysia marginata TaxID=1093978 RepID=A0AAV4JNC6_9GAST|nr:hypothetical protein ElyMa_003354100 [Elysia marginata]
MDRCLVRSVARRCPVSGREHCPLPANYPTNGMWTGLVLMSLDTTGPVDPTRRPLDAGPDMIHETRTEYNSPVNQSRIRLPGQPEQNTPPWSTRA